MTQNSLNRYILRQDNFIDVITFEGQKAWDFREMQKAKGRSWHSRPYEYKFVYDQISQYFSDTSSSGNLTLLDLACGTEHPGYIYFAQHPNVSKIHAVDLDQSLIENDLNHLKVEKTISDASSLPFPDECVDLVVCVSALEHMEDWKGAFHEMYRVLTKTGRAILTFDISEDEEITRQHGVDGKQPGDYRNAAESSGFRLLGSFDDDIAGAVDIVNSEFAMYTDPNHLQPGQHRSLKAFRMVLVK